MAKSRRSKTRISAPGTKHALNAEQALTVAQAKRLTSKAPNKADAWLQLGIAYVGVNRHSEAIEPLQRAVSLSGEAAHIHAWLAAAYLGASEFLLAKESAKHALNLDEHSVRALIILAMIDFDNGLSAGALKWIEKAENVEPENSDVLHAKSRALFGLHRYEEAEAVLEALTRHHPENLRYWNELGVVQRELGKLASSANSFSQAIKYGDNSTPFSNLITGFHYDPSKQQSDIAAVCREWQSRYGVKKPPARPVPENRSPDRKLRIGLLSDGFRQHPVGNMIIAALENTHPEEMEFYFYSTSASNDAITKRFQALASQWQMVKYQDDAAFNQQVRDDKIDILFDLAGHNAGTRSKAISMQPAPLIVKWVGGLINTTGVEAIDYLISDHIETPEGEDQHYTEKLIRLPDDYIVYSQPTYTPNIGPLPALSNDFITLGCFNNPTKLNAQLLTEWAILMNQLPNSRLFLKGKPYTSESFCERIYALMESLGVERERVLLEGPAAHRELLNSYNRVDIALDPWPYSGGLSTCEALLMGVPVVTLPGPTFAGRHSASHLINADMAELVVNNWDEYRERVIELASDTDSLSTIRNSLRQVLLQSPMCDGRRFAKHLMLAMRAIWQRYCEDKVPAALAFNKNSELWFEDDQKLLDIQVKEKPPEPEKGFKWKFDGQIVVLDNASKTLRNRALSLMVKTNAFAIVAFDPQSLIENREVFTANKNIQLFQHALLGDGKSTTLYACLEPTLSSTLPPLPNEQLPPSKRLGAKVLTKLPISTIALDSIQGLASLDWLVLDGLSDAATILENGAEALKDTLLVEVQVAFQATHERQPNLAELQYWASRNGFRFYRLNASRYISHLPESVPTKKRQATELESADAIFLPNYERMANLSDNQRTKLAFLLHTIYGIKDMTYELLAQVSQEKAEEYLVEEGLAEKMKKLAVKREVIYDPSQLVCNQRKFTLCVGVPVYNEERYIRETIQSLKNQDFGDVKFLISDNCSTDGTLDILREETACDERFEIFQHSKNVGAAKNFKFLFENTKSKYFVWLGAHDSLSKSYLSLAVDEIEKSSNVTMVMGKPMAIDEMSNLIGFMSEAVYDFSSDKSEDRYLKSVALLANCTVLHSVFSRDALLGFDFRGVISFDHVLISHLLWYGKLKNIDAITYFRRFFNVRNESQEERISGGNAKLDRESFYEYYLDDLKRLTKNLDASNLDYLYNKVKNTIKARFYK